MIRPLGEGNTNLITPACHGIIPAFTRVIGIAISAQIDTCVFEDALGSHFALVTRFCVCVSVYVCVSVCIYMCVCITVYICEYVQEYVCVSLYVCVSVCVCMCVSVCVCE